MPHQPFKLLVRSDCERKASPLQEDAFDPVGRHETSSIDHLSNVSNINLLDKEETFVTEDSFTEKASTSLSSIHKQKYGPSVSGKKNKLVLGVNALNKYVGSLGGNGTFGVASSASYPPKELKKRNHTREGATYCVPISVRSHYSYATNKTYNHLIDLSKLLAPSTIGVLSNFYEQRFISIVQDLRRKPYQRNSDSTFGQGCLNNAGDSWLLSSCQSMEASGSVHDSGLRLYLEYDKDQAPNPSVMNDYDQALNLTYQTYDNWPDKDPQQNGIFSFNGQVAKEKH
ncbi:hypothetical protein QJS10_CPA08g00737 [Acorus calamus]|uniref:Uncharacterized protein n=1 Tax=Acorus calamus TaxID=4465 RepID=A0AAV9E9R3_ACOCL|nr:hypothetical protein QJS10_CPA08g00737 [Acorus calamus]